MNELIIANSFEKNKNSFLETTLGKAVNATINYGLKKFLPDFIEDEIIDIKDDLIKNGLGEGVKSAINKTIDFGKSTIGSLTGKFDNINQIEMAVEKGGIVDNISKIIDNVIKNVKSNNIINNETGHILKESKNILKRNLSKNINEILEQQKEISKKINNNFEKWESAFKEKDYYKMEEEYNNSLENIKDIIPFEEINIKIKKMENINSILKNNNYNFNVSKLELEVAQKI